VWDNVAVRRDFPDIVPVVAQIKTMAWAANLIRYHVLEHFGGIYLDTDIVPLRSLEPLLNYSAFTVCQSPFQKSDKFKLANHSMPTKECKQACNAVIGAKPHHPALQQAIEKSMNNTLERLEHSPFKMYSLEISGPPRWTEAAKNYSDVVFLRSFTFYPCMWHEKQNCIKERYLSDARIFAMHTWAKSWGKKKGKR